MMKKIFFSEDRNFSYQLESFLKERASSKNDLEAVVGNIIEKVKTVGDKALIKYTQKFDEVDLQKVGFFYNKAEIEDSVRKCSPEDKLAIDLAISRIKDYHKKQLPENISWKDKKGVELGWFWRPIDRVGVYVPGGKASYPSSAIMNIVPALVAGVKDIVLTSPTPKNNFNPLTIYAASSMKVKEILKLGGAHAISALAFGTETIKSVDKITGPGNEYVAEAKRQVFGEVGVDSVAGPSEVLLICDQKMPAQLAAIDLLSQAEHDEKAQSILITDDRDYALKVEQEIERYLKKLKRQKIARASWKKFGAIIIVPNFERAIKISNMIAPEHLQLCFSDADSFLNNIKNAGSIFLGRWSPEAMGDYITGSNHVLPTNGTAKFSSSLSVFDFLKRVSVTKLNKRGFEELAPNVIRLANSEGLQAHALSVSERVKYLK